MAKITFEYTEQDMKDFNREANKIEFEVPDDMNNHEFNTMCIRLAQAIGYHSDSIERGMKTSHTNFEEKNDEITLLLDSLIDRTHIGENGKSRQ